MRTRTKEWIILLMVVAVLVALLALNYVVAYWPVSGYFLVAMSGYIILFGIIISQRIRNAILKDTLNKQTQKDDR